MSDCLFCKIVDGSIPAAKVYQDYRCVAFADIAPKAPVHLLFVPREHFAGADEVTDAREALTGHLVQAAAKVARQQGLEKDGYRLVINQGAHAGQTVFHLHLHLLAGRPLESMG